MRKTNILNKIRCTRYGEHGQITVLMVLAVVALFGAAALSIDGGLLYFQMEVMIFLVGEKAKTVLASGTFDLLHMGHVSILTKQKKWEEKMQNCLLSSRETTL